MNGTAFPTTNAMETATVNCPSGFTGNITRFCNAAGNWTEPVNNCSKFWHYCFIIVPVATGGCPATSTDGYSWPATDNGATSTLSCLEGYNGTVTRTCTDGTWGPVDSSGCRTFYMLVLNRT